LPQNVTFEAHQQICAKIHAAQCWSWPVLLQQLATLLITRQVVGNIRETLIPYFIEKLKLFRIGYEMTKDLSENDLKKQAHDIVAEQKCVGVISSCYLLVIYLTSSCYLLVIFLSSSCYLFVIFLSSSCHLFIFLSSSCHLLVTLLSCYHPCLSFLDEPCPYVPIISYLSLIIWWPIFILFSRLVQSIYILTLWNLFSHAVHFSCVLIKMPLFDATYIQNNNKALFAIFNIQVHSVLNRNVCWRWVTQCQYTIKWYDK